VKNGMYHKIKKKKKLSSKINLSFSQSGTDNALNLTNFLKE